jgi:hypothetical protein
MPEQGDRGEHATALAEDQHRVERVQPGATVFLSDQQARPAGLLGRRPQVGERPLVAVERRARGLERLEA